MVAMRPSEESLQFGNLPNKTSLSPGRQGRESAAESTPGEEFREKRGSGGSSCHPRSTRLKSEIPCWIRHLEPFREPEHKEILGMSHATTSALNEVRPRPAPVACLPVSAGWTRMPHSRCSTRISNRRLLTGAENLSASLPGWRRGR